MADMKLKIIQMYSNLFYIQKLLEVNINITAHLCLA